MSDVRIPGTHASFWHTGVVVTDIGAAMTELERSTGAEWLAVQERPDGDRSISVSFSTTPPYIELIQGNSEGLWTTAHGPRLDHLAYWTDAFHEDCANFERLGFHREAGGTSVWGGNWAYFRLVASGLRIELCDTAGRDAFLARWNLPAAHTTR